MAKLVTVVCPLCGMLQSAYRRHGEPCRFCGYCLCGCLTNLRKRAPAALKRRRAAAAESEEGRGDG